MRFSFWCGNTNPWSEILRSGVRADETGWDGVWTADHFMPNAEDNSGPMHEAWGVLAALAARTERVRLGPLVCGNTYRHPAVLLKQAVTVDHISGGRVVLGMGAGWQENEHVAYGIEFGTFSQRFAKLEESLRVLRALRDTERDPAEPSPRDRVRHLGAQRLVAEPVAVLEEHHPQIRLDRDRRSPETGVEVSPERLEEPLVTQQLVDRRQVSRQHQALDRQDRFPQRALRV